MRTRCLLLPLPAPSQAVVGSPQGPQSGVNPILNQIIPVQTGKDGDGGRHGVEAQRAPDPPVGEGP